MTEYELSFSAWGKTVLRDTDDTDFMSSAKAFEEFKKKYKCFPKSISLEVQDSSAFGYCIHAIDTAFLEKLKTLKELILPDAVTHIDMTPELERILKENDTLIRGRFDSYAERFATENGLHFRPADYLFASYMYEPVQESTDLTLVFMRNGNVKIVERVSSPGSSAGNTFGGCFEHPLKKDLYLTQTAEDIAQGFRGAIYDEVINDGRLAAFLEKAKEHGYYTGKN